MAYFDGPGGTQVPAVVADRMRDYLLHHNANTHWAYPTSHETDAAIAAARGALADFLNASPEEVAFGANMTTLTFHLSRALAREWQAGDEVIVTELDHHGNVDPWRAVARDRGLTIRSVPMNTATGELDWDALERAFSPRTKLLAIGAASNILGTITDVAAAARLARDAGALCFVDAVHYAPHALVDVRAIGCDLLVCSPYKFYGPHLGTVYVRRDLLERLDVPKVEPAADIAPERLETGTLSHEAIVGAGAAVDFLASLANQAAEPPRGARPDDGGAPRAWTEAGDASVGGAPCHARCDRLRATAVAAAHVHHLVCRRGCGLDGSGAPLRRARAVRVERRLLCDDGRPAPRARRRWARQAGLRRLHVRRRGRARDRGDR